ncbi:MAG: hypothetical protein WKG03_18115 [Telluria sp.]
MNRELFAKALADGVGVAYAHDFSDAVRLIDAVDVVSGDTYNATRTESVHWSYFFVQLLDDFQGGPAVEIAVDATDGIFEERIYVYSRKTPKVLDWSLASPDLIEDIRIELKGLSHP